MALLNERAHIAEEEGEHQGADVGAIHICIGPVSYTHLDVYKRQA